MYRLIVFTTLVSFLSYESSAQKSEQNITESQLISIIKGLIDSGNIIVTGKVIAIQKNKPAAYSSVLLSNETTQFTCLCSESGEFQFKNIAPGKYFMEV